MSELTAADFTAYDTLTLAEIQLIGAGPLALFDVPVDSIMPTQMNEGFAEVDAKAVAFDLFTSLPQVESDLLGDIEPVVIGPGGQLYLLDGHHTFTALIDSIWGASDPTVYVNVIANYSNDSEQQFIAQMETNNWLLPLNNGVPQTVDPNTGAPIPTSLTGLTSDVYRGLEYSILKEKDSKLFTTTNNITGAVGASTPGLDKMPGLYSDFAEAAAYQDALGGLGLPYLSPGDIALATQWNLNPLSTTTLPNVSGTVYAYQLPGFILSQNIVIGASISNATLGQAVSGGEVVLGSMEGAIDGNGTFTGITEINAGTAQNPILIDTPNIGLILQLGADKGFTVTLSNTNNTYIGGTTFLAGTLVIAGDGSLGAAPTETISAFYTSLTFDGEGFPDNVTAAVQADNGIIFNSLSEGNGTLTIGTTAGEFTSASPFTTSRPIAVGNEAATINVNGSYVELNGPLITLGYDNLGIGETDGFPALTIDDLSSGGGKTATAGTLILSTASPYFYGDIIIGNVGTPTVEVMSDAALGNTTGNPEEIGEIELNGGTLQTGASFSAPERDIVLDGGSQIDVDGNTTTWGTLTDVKRTIAIGNSNTTTAGAITFSSFTISQTSTLQLDGSANGTTYSGNETVTFTGGILQSAPEDTLFIDPSSATALGTAQEKVFSSGASTTLINGMAPAWIIADSGGSASTNPYNFLTYGANGYVPVTYTDTGSGSTGGIRTATSTSIVDQTGNATLAANAAAYALKVNDGEVITATGFKITLGDGTDPAGLIMGGGSAAITGGTLAFGASEAFIYAKGSSTISAAITGSNGLTLAGSGTLTFSAASPNLSGAITIDSGELSLTAVNVFSTDVAGITLGNVKSSPSNSILNFTANQIFTALNSIGTDSAITFSGAALTIGDTTNNLSSTLSSSITESGSALAGALTLDGSGLFDLSGMSSGTLSLLSGSSIVVNNSAQLRVVASEFANANFTIDLNGANTQLQFAQGGGGQFANAVSGTGELHLIGGTLQLSGTNNTYSGGTVVETGSTLDITTASLPAVNENITDAGGLIVFDQNTTGTFTGVISDGQEMGTGPMESGSLDKDDSSGDNGGNLIIQNAQAYSGATYVEAGEMTLGAVNTVADSSGVILGRVGGGSIATLALGANNTITALSSDPSNTTTVLLNGYVLTLAPTLASSSAFGGTIVDGSTPGGSLVLDGVGTATLSGADTFTGGVTLDSGILALGNSQATGSGAITFGSNANATLAIGLGDTPTNLIKGFAVGDTIDLQGVGTETNFTYIGGVLTVSGGSQSVQLDIAQPPAQAGFALATDGSGGTFVTVAADPGPTISSITPSTVEKGQTTEIATVTPGLRGDALTLAQTGGSGAVSLQLVSGVEEVIYTAPASIPVSTTDAVSYSITDEYNDVAANSANVQLDSGPMTGTTSIVVGHNQALNETALVGSLVTPGLASDTETITSVTGDATLSNQTITYQSPSSGTDSFTYTVQDELGGTATGTINVTVDPGPTISSITPSTVEKGQTTEIATVAPGLAGDVLTLAQTGGSGAVSLQLVSGVEEVIYTAPASIPVGTTDTVSYSITDEYNDVASSSANVQLDFGPSITSVTPATVEKGQTTEIGTVTPGLAGDTLTLTQTGGSGAVSLQLVNGVEEVLYTAPASIPASAIAAVTYTITDQHDDVAASGFASVQLDAGPTITAKTPATVEKGQTTEIATVTPGLAGDTLTLMQTSGSGTVSLQLVNGVEEVIYTAPASIPASAIAAVTYTITDQHDDDVASSSASVQLDSGPKAGTTSIVVGHNQTLNETALVDSLVTPGLAGDTETIIKVTGDATLSNQTITYQSPTSGTNSFTYTVLDELGGTATGTINVTVDPGPTITAKTPATVEKGQTTEIATVTPGLAGDTLTLTQTGGSGTVSLLLVSGVEEVIYTAPANVATATLDTVSYTITDEYNDVAMGSNTVSVAAAGDTVYVGTAGGSLNVGNGDSAINGMAGNENIQAGNGADVVFAGPSDTINLGNGNDTVLGGSNDTIQAGNGTDTISTGANSHVTLGNNPDTVMVGDNSTVVVGNGQDSVAAGADAVITGGNGNDTVSAGTGSTVSLGNGADTVIAGTDNIIKLGNGADTIYASAGDTITVGNGHDTFVFGLSPGTTTAGTIGPVTINGFSPSNDVIKIASTLATWDSSYAALASHITAGSGGNAVIHLDTGGDIITLVGLSASSLHAGDFQFV